MNRLIKLSFCFIIGMGVLVSCKTVPSAQPAPSVPRLTGVLTGHVRYLEKIALPEAFWIEIQLVQLNSNGSPGAILARAMTEKPTRTIPVPFMMRYSPKAVSPGTHKYGLIACIYVGKKLWFMNETPYPVFQGKDNDIDIIAQKVE